MSKKKKSKKIPVPAIPHLSLKALDDVQEIERYARQELRDCENRDRFNTQKAERILRACTVQVLKIQLVYYESLPTFHEKWIIELQEDAIESAVGMIPGGYADELYEYFRNVLWDTTYADLNPPKPKQKKSQPTSESRAQTESIAAQINRLRNECHLSTEELAVKINIDPRSVKRHLAGKSRPYPQHLRAYQTVFSELLNRPVSIRS
jgi:DNA-binding transcriptional regulator YiaG